MQWKNTLQRTPQSNNKESHRCCFCPPSFGHNRLISLVSCSLKVCIFVFFVCLFVCSFVCFSNLPVWNIRCQLTFGGSRILMSVWGQAEQMTHCSLQVHINRISPCKWCGKPNNAPTIRGWCIGYRTHLRSFWGWFIADLPHQQKSKKKQGPATYLLLLLCYDQLNVDVV
jgi:hypothetical protein